MNKFDALVDEVASTLRVGIDNAKEMRVRTWHQIGKIVNDNSIEYISKATNIPVSPLRDAVQFAKQHPDIERFILDNPQLDCWTKIRKYVKKM